MTSTPVSTAKRRWAEPTLRNGGSFVERYHGMEDIPPEHRIFAYPKLNIREQMEAYQEVIDRSALNEEKLRLPTSREDR